MDEGERVLARLLDALQRLARKGADDCSSAAAEIDVFAGYGSHPRVFTGTIHPHSGACLFVAPDAVNSNTGSRDASPSRNAFIPTQSAAEAEEGDGVLDQRRVMSWPVFRTTNTRMFLGLNVYTGGESTADSSTPGRVAHEGRLGSCLAEALTRPVSHAPEPTERSHVIAPSREGRARCSPRTSPGTRSISCSTRGLRGERVALGPRPELLHDPARASCSGS